ncbi:5'-nucleotidase C-terminal domain-containing protein [Paenibacillus validus]|uniref:5'-nucleotidase C-terminal domain-containing protein n=1 Tax=Paenibacillus validus TaxID=44253 RepID=UPI000FD93043|nr:5'-nucleotidase C-terminal domain-containing protein [Paenibacillus validus]MED4599805.1 5'-nucleotidase C-terminal domain-containing protein [Paenibacillus validus]MED4604665.1 5'-nucleotidase C-terminal domain-containing protein [Paenibacillus validus]
MASMATAAAADSGPAAGTSAKKITILHTNDVHARVEESKEGIGYAKMATLIKEFKASNPNTLVVDAGDTFHGQTIANLVRGESVVNIMNAIGYDVMAAGNHDFNYGYARLQELAKTAKFPILGANVKKADGSRVLGTTYLKEVGGVKVGFFGLTTPETAYKTHPKNVEGITFADPVAEAKAMVAELKDKADVIVAVAHLGVDKSSVDTSLKVAEQVAGIDVIIDGHSHTTMEKGMMVGNVLIAQTGEYSKNFGKVELTFENGKLTGKTASLITKSDTEMAKTVSDKAVLDIVTGIKKEQEQELSKVVGSTAVKLVGDREVVRVGESNLGNLIADAMLDETKADVAITNGGGIRASIEPGQITKGQVITVLPFGNYIQTKKVKGSDIKAALELGVSAYPDSLGGFPHVAGIKFTIDPSQPKNQRVTSVTIKDQPLEPNNMYVLATNDFMASGGDQYTMFMDYPLAGDFSSLEESLISYLQKKGEVAPKTEGRIEVKAPGVQQTPAPASAPVQEKPAAPAPAKQEAAVYSVKKGDSLWKIANMYQTTWQTLQQLNRLKNPNLIFPGQQIILP